ncbi:MAG TPA: dihydrodipicolinate synthase family protein [Trueperaceae bacterium]|nr:dihydrodipicolinate synthase family protein [Trueperaceae bacterium]
MQVAWDGVIPAITTPFTADMEVDLDLMARHARWLVDAGCVGIVPFGSLGEGATVAYGEKLRAIERLAAELAGAAPLVPAVSSLSTAEAVRYVEDAERAGASGFMVLPPYVYASDWREMRAHVAAVLAATDKPCMLYNNPLAYVTDFLPEHVAELHAEFPHMNAVKESSADVRRVTALRALMPDSFTVLIGVDDLVVEAVTAGARGWIAGLVNAFPAESVRLFELALAGRLDEARELYRWFLPLLRLDVGTRFVQKIKLTQETVGWGSARVRGPRLELAGPELEATRATIERALATRPAVETVA